ncbi:MAG: hypothetical protein Q7T81_15675 [Pseudolabrys sp.]|nr:hypothetical protein [Pseudolabrys sp.]
MSMIVSATICYNGAERSGRKTIMAQPSEHGRIIAAAAKAALAPIGCVRKGQSRTWRADHRYWVIDVEFQPSGWQKGSYLNISVAWLWNVTHGYDFAYRAGSFIPFETAEQFTPPIRELAAIAATEVLKVREQFGSFSDILDYIKADNRRAPWPGFNAAIVCGLAGDIVSARQYFHEVEAWDTDKSPWRARAKIDAIKLEALLDRPERFRDAVAECIARRRQLMGLPPDPHCFDELDSKATP